MPTELIILAILALIVIAIVMNKRKKSRGNVTAESLAGVITGNLQPPLHEDRIIARNNSLASRGIALTADEDLNNVNAGGGAPDGGVFLLGPFNINVAPNGNLTGTCQLFLQVTELGVPILYDIAGTMQADGSINGSWSGNGVSGGKITGKVTNNSVTGKYMKWEGMEWVYGVLEGTYTKA